MNILPVVGGIISLFGALSQQQQAAQAAGLSREALELQKKVIDAYLEELRELKPYREAMRELTATRMTMAPIGWSKWTSDPWRLTTSLPPIQKLLNPPRPQNPSNSGGGGTRPPGGEPGDRPGPYEPPDRESPDREPPKPPDRTDGPTSGPGKGDVVAPGKGGGGGIGDTGPGKGDVVAPGKGGGGGTGDDTDWSALASLFAEMFNKQDKDFPWS
jgi:hypothetical protein